MQDQPFRLDRTKFKMQSFAEASRQLAYWRTKTPVERLRAAYFLIAQAYNFDLNNPPRLDRTKFSVREHANRE